MPARLPRISRRLTAGSAVTALVASGLAAVVLAPAARADDQPTPVCANGVCTVTYGPTPVNTVAKFTVPSGVTSLTAKLQGAQGGGFSGGLGGSTTGTIRVNEGDKYTLIVGARGSAGDGNGTAGGGGSVVSGSGANSGGGGSFLSNQFQLLLAAGGGGGAAIGASGGAGGGSRGGDGPGDPNYQTTVATGGTQTNGGTGGKATLGGTPLGTAGNDGNGPAGASGAVGGGGKGNDPRCCGSSSTLYGGGGGGGGYYGGGGGGYDAGGAGGSGYVPDGNFTITDVTTASGVQTGNGSISLSWALATTTTKLDASSTSAVTKPGDTVKLTASVSSNTNAPTGTVKFLNVNPNNGGSTTISGCDSQAVDASGNATCSTSFTTAGTYKLRAVYSGSSVHQGSTSDDLTYKVRDVPYITTTSLDNATYNTSYSQTLATSGATKPYKYSIAFGALPDGLSLDADTGVISGTPTAATSTPASFTVQVDSPNNESGSTKFTLNVNKASQKVGFTFEPTNPAVGDTYTIPTTEKGASDQPLVLTGNDNCTVSDLTVSFVHADTCKITATQDGNDNYLAAKPIDQSATVAKASQTIALTSTAPQDAKVGETYTVTATGGSSANPVTFKGNTYCTVESTQSQTAGEFAATVTFVKAGGDCVITTNQDGDTDYTAASEQTQQIGVGKGTQAVNFTSDQPSDARVNGTYKVATSGNTKSGSNVELSIDSASSTVCSLDGATVYFNHPGTCIVNASQAGTDDYNESPVNNQTITVGKADQKVTFSSTAPTPVVGDSYTPLATGDPKSGTAVTYGVNATPSDACTITDGKVSFDHPGLCSVRADEQGSDDYNAGGDVQLVSIDKASGSVTITSELNGPTTVGATYTPTLEAGPGAGTPAFEIDSTTTNNACSLAAGKFTFDHPGTCAIKATQTGGRDYTDATSKVQSFSITKGRQSVSFTLNPTDPTVGGTYEITSFTKGNGSAEVVFSGNANCTVSGKTVTFVHAGQCTVTASQDGDDDYTPAKPIDHDTTVAQAGQKLLVTSDPPSEGIVSDSHVLKVTGGTSSSTISVGISDSTTNSACSLGTVDASPFEGVQRAKTVISYDKVGTCSIVIEQGGDDDYTAASTTFVKIEIAGKPTTTKLSLSSANTVHGQAETATATVTGTTAGRVIFFVDKFYYDSQQLGSDGTATSRNLAAPVVEPTGIHTRGALPRGLAVGGHTVTARFIPDDLDTYAGSETATGSSLTVTSATSTTALKVKPKSLTATVAITAPSADIPTGTVTFGVAGKSVGTADVLDGVATLNYTVPAGDTRKVSAIYSGRLGTDSATEVQGSSASTARKDPRISATVTSTVGKSRFGWYSKPVVVRFTCAAGSAGLATPCPAPVRYRGNGIHDITRTVLTKDGGAKTINVTVKIDHSRPAVSITGPESGHVYPGSLPRARCVSADPVSGIASCRIVRAIHGIEVTYTAVATDKAGNIRSSHVTVRRSPARIVGATYSGRYPVVHRGHGYTIVYSSKTRPTYVYAAPAPQRPSGTGTAFTKIGRNRWSYRVTFTEAMAAHALWNLGVRTGSKTRTITVKVVG